MSTALAVFVEKWAPAILAGVGAFLFLSWGMDFFIYAELKNLSVNALYQAVFDTSSIVCAFLFSFLIFIKTTENDFLSAFRDKPVYKRLEKHFIYAIVGSFVLTIVTIPMLVSTPSPKELMSAKSLFVMLWFSFTFYVVGCTVRSGYQFLAVLDAAYSERFKRL